MPFFPRSDRIRETAVTVMEAGRIRIPGILCDTMGMVSGMNTPLAMIVAGVCIAESDIREAFTRRRFYYIALIRNLVGPMLAVLGLSALPFMDRQVLLVVAILTATPIASVCITFALRYRRDHRYAAQAFALSNVFSVVSIPLVTLLAERLSR